LKRAPHELVLERKVVKMTKKFFSTLLVLAMTFVLTASLAGCGKDDVSAKPPTDDIGQVAGETQDQGQTLEGTYRTEQTPPTGLGTELTFTADGTVTDNTGDGAGTYKIDGDKLTIEYQGIKVPYTFSSDGHTVILNGVEYVFADSEDVEAAPPGDPDAAWYGLILHINGVREYGTDVNVPESATIDESIYAEYVRDNLAYLIDVRDVPQSSEIRQYIDAPVRVESPEFHFYQPGAYDQVGLVFEFQGNASYVKPDGSEISHGGVVHGQLGDVYYSPTLGRVLTYGEVFEAKKITYDEFFEQYPGYIYSGTE
jgi:predicted small lipoprotein YifL